MRDATFLDADTSAMIYKTGPLINVQTTLKLKPGDITTGDTFLAMELITSNASQITANVEYDDKDTDNDDNIFRKETQVIVCSLKYSKVSYRILLLIDG